MKTKHNNQKTENRKFKMMVLRASAVVFSLVLISLTSTSAQEIWEQFFNSADYNKMVMAETGVSSEYEKADLALEAIYSELEENSTLFAETFYYATETDDKLEIEAWMTDETYFGENVLTIENETDDALVVEQWMISDSNFSNNTLAIADETESSLEIESWMIDAETFQSSKELSAQDSDLDIETWMIENEYFRNEKIVQEEMQLEAWMTDGDLWNF